jgi:hypothetical protein
MMSKSNRIEVRLHSQEREWLQNLGNGSILEGVRNLVEDAKNKRTKNQIIREDYARRKKWKW